MTYHDDILTEELAELLDHDVPPAEAPDGLAELISLAGAVREHTEVPRPDPVFRHDLRRHLVAEIEASQVTWLDRVRDTVWARTASLRHSVRVAVASGLASSLIGGAGVAVAAQQALPGDVLYDVKRATESARMAIASGAEETGRLRLELAAERLEEVTEGLSRLTPDEVIDTLEDMDAASLAGTDDLVAAALQRGDEEPLETVESFVVSQREGLSAIFDRLPIEAVPAAEESLEVLRRIDAHVTTTAAVPAPEEPAIPPVPASTLAPEPTTDTDDPTGTPGDAPADDSETSSETDPELDPTLPPQDPLPDPLDDTADDTVDVDDVPPPEETPGTPLEDLSGDLSDDLVDLLD